jgi:hypothetical protein
MALCGHQYPALGWFSRFTPACVGARLDRTGISGHGQLIASTSRFAGVQSVLVKGSRFRWSARFRSLSSQAPL